MRKHLSELAILTAASIVAAGSDCSFIVLRLAGNAESNARNCDATRLRNPTVACFAIRQAFATRQLATRIVNGVLDCCIDLVLHCAVFGETTRHIQSLGNVEIYSGLV
jgi:hypothetical protein